MKKFLQLKNILLARNSHRPEIKLSQSVMVELLSGLSYNSYRGSIAQNCTFRFYSVGCLLGVRGGALNKLSISRKLTFKNTSLYPRLFSTKGKEKSLPIKLSIFLMRTTIIMVGVIISKCLLLCWCNETYSWLDFFDNIQSLSSVLVGIGSFASISIGKLLDFTPINIKIRDLFVHSRSNKFTLKNLLDLFSSVWNYCKFNYKIPASLTGEGHLRPKGLSGKKYWILTQGDSPPSSSGNQGGENPSGNPRGENPSGSSSKKLSVYKTQKAISDNKINFPKNRSSYEIDQAQKAQKLIYPQKEGESDRAYNKRIERAERVKYASESRKYREVIPHRSRAEVIESRRKLSESMPKMVGESDNAYDKRVKNAESKLNYANKRAAAMGDKGLGGSRKFSTFSKSSKRYFSTLPKNNNKSLSEVESKFKAKLSTFLSNVSSVLANHSPTKLGCVAHPALDYAPQLRKDKFILENFYDWFRGFTDAEGCFIITHLRDKFWRFTFEMKLHIDDVKVLIFIQNTLGIGKVYKFKASCRFIVSKQSEVKKLIEIFTHYSLNSSKILNFHTWVKAFNLYIEGSDNSAEEIFNKVEILKSEMNTKRTDWTSNHKINITPYWLLGFVEGDGSWSVNKKNLLLSFSIAQSYKDLKLMEAIKNYLNNLSMDFDDVVNLGLYKSKTGNKSDMINLNVTKKTEFISQVLVPFFQKMVWISKKEMDFIDWVSILNLKELGLHHSKEGVLMINRILNQMNNNRLSTGIRLQVDRDLLLGDLNVMLEGDSNYEPNAEGKIVIKSSGKLLKKGIPIRVLILDDKGNNLKELESINACGTYLGISHDTVRVRLNDGKPIKFNSRLVYVKKKIANIY